MARDKLRIGLVGLGTYVEIAHMPTYFESRYSERIEMAAICDINAERLKQWQKKYDIAGGYTDFQEMLDKETLDAVVVATPDHLHTDIACKAIEAGCDVLVEKPLATDLMECDRIIRTARRYKRRVVTDFHKRHDPAHQDAREKILSGLYGQLQMGYVWMQDTINVPAGSFFKSNFAASSSVVWFLGVHFFDLIRFLTDLQPVQVTAQGYRQVLAARGVDTYDAVKSDVIFDNGGCASFYLSWNLPETAPYLTRQGLYLQFERGDVYINSQDRGYVTSWEDGYRTVNPMYTRRTPAGVAGYAHESIGEALMEFLQLKLTGRKDYERLIQQDPSDVNGLYATLMGQATHASLDSGTRIKNGQVILGATIETNRLLKEQLGDNAADYLLRWQQ